ncbi:MAG: type II toxin-antitoxin system RelE/ParE family toxin [Candidatus Omnitrophica bacterium]|nr:type II toxin-antitoxin system RelE/ParE family toxin [Candidatus Omnitrophota bacterium]MCA9448449.1 type II toxin-antitoxin system RelE/ParE family toxin [Candidatus Omnitrophota bacterium]
MKSFEIVIQDSAIREMEVAYEWIADEAPMAATNWYNGCIDAVESLREFPKRCPLAPENEFFKPEIRQLLYGERNRAYRILFTIHKNSVHILHVRHGAMRWLGEEN